METYEKGRGVGMHQGKLNNAIYEAERFLVRAKAARKMLTMTSWARGGCKETGAVKRASMDLTRALADMRGRCRE